MEKEKKGLSAWQLTMMALGTVIGGSFFVGSSIAINTEASKKLTSTENEKMNPKLIKMIAKKIINTVKNV